MARCRLRRVLRRQTHLRAVVEAPTILKIPYHQPGSTVKALAKLNVLYLHTEASAKLPTYPRLLWDANYSSRRHRKWPTARSQTVVSIQRKVFFHLPNHCWCRCHQRPTLPLGESGLGLLQINLHPSKTPTSNSKFDHAPNRPSFLAEQSKREATLFAGLCSVSQR